VSAVDGYLVGKALHILSATILFGTGIGIAFFFWSARQGANDAARLFAARTTVTADFLFTLPAVILQPLTGFWMVRKSGIDPAEAWLVFTYCLYGLAGACWLPVVWLQVRMKRMLERKLDGGPFDEKQFQTLRGIWFALGWPAFGGLVVVFWLMVAKPGW